MITYKQLSLADIFSDCQEKFENDKRKMLGQFHQDLWSHRGWKETHICCYQI